ncbi:MAG: hypothetical protein V4689_14520 [Verrucomicrobiota bacterium]
MCEIKDIGTWEIAARAIIRHIDADEYQLVCPDAQIADFESATCAGWNVVGEGRYSENCGLSMILSRVKGENQTRGHWLFQQFVKINAINQSGLEDSDLVLIWDADTVPLRRIDFIDAVSGRVAFYHGAENHPPYFDTMTRLLGYGKLTDKSFIAQCLPVRVGWVRQFVGGIESEFNAPFAAVVLDLLPGQSGSEFSEYETLGTWILKNHPDEVVFKARNRWLRSGANLLKADREGYRSRMILRGLSLYYDFVAIERWSRPVTWKRVIGKIARLFST